MAPFIFPGFMPLRDFKCLNFDFTEHKQLQFVEDKSIYTFHLLTICVPGERSQLGLRKIRKDLNWIEIIL